MGQPRIMLMRKPRQGPAPPSAAPWPGLPPGENPFCLAVDSVRDYAIFLIDAQGVVQSWNTGGELILGYAADEIIGRNFSLFYSQEEVDTGWPQRELATAARDGRFEDEGWRVRKNGERFWANSIVTAMHAPDGTLYGFSTILRDLTERKQQEEALKRSVERSRQLWAQAVKDPLTGAFNRRYMAEQLNGAIERSSWMTASLVVFDIDHFKGINDRHGHVSGDTVLMGVTSLARRLSRDTDVLFRMGGDEFALFLPGASRKDAAGMAERLRAAVEHAQLLKGCRVTVSAGVAELRPHDDAEGWIHRADAALYESKRAGRNRITLAPEKSA